MTLWFLSRAAGMVALLAFTVSMVLGVLAARPRRGSTVRQLDRRFLTQMAHRSAAITGLVLLATHATLMVLDSFVPVSVSGALVPFAAGYRPLALGLGTIAVYAFVAAAISGALRGRVAGSDAVGRRWRYVHLSAYAGWALAMGHGVLAGTDTQSWWAISIYVTCALAVITATTVRIGAETRHRNNPLVAARTLTPRSLI